MCPTLCDPMDGSPPGSSVHGDSPGKNTGVGCHALLQGIFPTQGSNLSLMSPALAGGLFTTSTTSGVQWDSDDPQKHQLPFALTIDINRIELLILFPRKLMPRQKHLSVLFSLHLKTDFKMSTWPQLFIWELLIVQIYK